MTELVVVTNQLPFDLDLGADGTPRWMRRPGGLRAALGPALSARGMSWVGWPGVPDAELAAFDDDGLSVHPVRLSADDIRDYLEGFSNATLWPLYHDVLQRPVFDRGWWDAYVRVNQRFAEVVADLATAEARVWVHDYQLQLVPAMLRERRPDLRIMFFLDTPFPPNELFMRLPWRAEIVRGLIGADLIGFHRPNGAQNFLWLARQLLGLEPSRGTVGIRARPGVIMVGDRAVRIGAYPASIDSTGVDTIARSREVVQRADEIRATLGSPRRVLLGVERLEYIKGTGELNYSMGIDLRLQALHELLAERRVAPQDVVAVQLTVLGTRADARHYEQLRRDVERIAGQMNSQFATAGHPVVRYLQQPTSPEELAAFYLAADVLVLTPLRDGISLVAKEYIASRNDLGGALVLSEFSGSAAELTSAFLVNPYDVDGVKNAIVAAIDIDPAEGRRRMRALRRQVLTHDGDRWGRSFLEALADRSPGQL